MGPTPRVRRRARVRGTTLAFLLVTLGGISSAAAQDANPTLAADWMFSAGAAFTRNEAKVGLAPGGEPVDLIDLDDLGLSEDDTDFFFQATWQAPERWRLNFTTYVSELDGGRFTDQDYVYGDLEIPAGSGVAIDFKTRFYILNAHYAIWQEPNWEVGVGAGIYALDWEGGIALVEGGTDNTLGRESEDFLAPLPTLGLFARYAFTDRLALRLGADWLSANIDDYDGEVLAGVAGLDWWFAERWGLSAGLNLVDIDVQVDDEPFNEYVDASWESVYLNLNFAF